MKRLLIIGIIAVWFTACNKNVSSTAVPDNVITAFNQRYPTARDVDWALNSDGLYEAEFMIGNQKKEAVYRPDGDIVKAENM